jgi:hypothetical protein
VDGELAADTGALAITPPALDLELVLDCRPPDTDKPVISIEEAPAESPTSARSMST